LASFKKDYAGMHGQQNIKSLLCVSHTLMVPIIILSYNIWWRLVTLAVRYWHFGTNYQSHVYSEAFILRGVTQSKD